MEILITLIIVGILLLILFIEKNNLKKLKRKTRSNSDSNLKKEEEILEEIYEEIQADTNRVLIIKNEFYDNLKLNKENLEYISRKVLDYLEDLFTDVKSSYSEFELENSRNKNKEFLLPIFLIAYMNKDNTIVKDDDLLIKYCKEKKLSAKQEIKKILKIREYVDMLKIYLYTLHVEDDKKFKLRINIDNLEVEKYIDKIINCDKENRQKILEKLEKEMKDGIIV